MVLVGLESLQIRALHSQSAHSVSIRGAVLEAAETLPAGRHANNVEICMCPANYLGDSCQVRLIEKSSLIISSSCYSLIKNSIPYLLVSFIDRNALQVSTETLLVCFWGNVFPVTVTDTLITVWTDLESVW